MTDLVYIYELGLSSWRDQELKFSLRSVEKHMKNYRNIYIIGQAPAYINLETVNVIPFDTPNVYKEHRIMLKFKKACEIPGISQKFLMMNDDYFLVKDINAAKIPYYYDFPMYVKYIHRGSNDIYKQSINNTLLALNKLGVVDPKYFDIHYPVHYDKTKFPLIMDSLDWNIRGCYVIKSLYCNLMRIKGKKRKDCKINKDPSPEEMKHIIESTDLFSTDRITRPIINTFHKLYPEPSKYEL